MSSFLTIFVLLFPVLLFSNVRANASLDTLGAPSGRDTLGIGFIVNQNDNAAESFNFLRYFSEVADDEGSQLIPVLTANPLRTEYAVTGKVTTQLLGRGQPAFSSHVLQDLKIYKSGRLVDSCKISYFAKLPSTGQLQYEFLTPGLSYLNERLSRLRNREHLQDHLVTLEDYEPSIDYHATTRLGIHYLKMEHDPAPNKITAPYNYLLDEWKGVRLVMDLSNYSDHGETSAFKIRREVSLSWSQSIQRKNKSLPGLSGFQMDAIDFGFEFKPNLSLWRRTIGLDAFGVAGIGSRFYFSNLFTKEATNVEGFVPFFRYGGGIRLGWLTASFTQEKELFTLFDEADWNNKKMSYLHYVQPLEFKSITLGFTLPLVTVDN